MNNKLKDLPFFFPKIKDTTLFNLDTDVKGVLLEAHYSKWRSNIIPAIKEKRVLFILDPVTHMLMFKSARDKVNYKRLPYTIEPDLEKFYSDSTYRNNKFLIPCLNYQLEKDSDIIIAPYLFSDNPWDTIFSINLTMIAESKKYLDDLNITKPLFAMITFNSNVLEKPTVVNYIVDRYNDESMSYLNGYFILIDNLDCKKSDYSQLFGLAKLVNQLSNNKYVFLKQIGGFGEILCAIGLTGFISGLNIGETFSLKYIEKNVEYFKKHKRVYIPELFTYINEEDARKINYRCNCSFCNGTFNTSSNFQNNHYLSCKIGITNDLSKLDRKGKINYMISKLEEAEKFSAFYSKKVIGFNSTYLRNWKQILEISKNWNLTSQDTIKIETLLEDLEKK